jgi:DNA gyrase subunit A
VLVTKRGQGFRFEYDLLREPTKRIGRKLVHLKGDDQVLMVRAEAAEFIAIAADTGKVLIFRTEKVPVLAGPGQGVRMIRLTAKGEVIAAELVNKEDRLVLYPRKGKQVDLALDTAFIGTRGTQGKLYCKTITSMERVVSPEVPAQ